MNATNEPPLAVEQLCLRRGGQKVVDDVSFTVGTDQVLALLGPSGAGKSSLLLAVAGLLPVASGRVLSEGTDITGMAPHQRPVGMVFQEYALFPHMDVLRNVTYGLHELPADEQRARAARWLDVVGLPLATYGSRDVAALSGGQRQRVAVARALAPQPRLLLLDEPFGALDRQLREELVLETRQLLRVPGGPMAAVVVTHDRDEAFAIGDAVGVMRDGRLLRVDAPGAIWADPRTTWMARFLGHANVLDADGARALGVGDTPLLLPVEHVRARHVATDDGHRVLAVHVRSGLRTATLEMAGQRVTAVVRDAPSDLGPGSMVEVEIDHSAAVPLVDDEA